LGLPAWSESTARGLVGHLWCRLRGYHRPASIARRARRTISLAQRSSRLTDEVAYLKLSAVSAAQSETYIKDAAGAKVLVIDIRNYPKEFVVFALGQHLVASTTPFARFTGAKGANPGAFTWTQPVSLTPGASRFAGTIVILVDETSQSQAEYTTMAFRTAPNAIVVGSTTAGADGNVSAIMLPGGLRSMISGIGVFYPDKTPTQRVGIKPDLVVRPTIQGIQRGRDEVLEAGVSRALGREFRLPQRPLQSR
jgi:C-terminal processing protease CtpA/Prc